MSSEIPAEGLQLRSTVTAEGTVEVALVRVPVPRPKDDEVLVRIGRRPSTPRTWVSSSPAPMWHGRARRDSGAPLVSAPIAPERLRALAGRVGQAMPVGNEGAGVVVAAGPAAQARALVGKVVGVIGGEMYSQYRCLRLPSASRSPRALAGAGASWFVNPLTALGMVETMRREGHRALVHTAAASNLGQMLVRLCRADGVPLVNVVRRPEQVAVLAALGATHVVDSSQPGFGRPSPRRSPRRARRWPSTRWEAERWPASSSTPWRRRRASLSRGTGATERPSTSRCTCTVPPIPGRRCSSRTWGPWRGASGLAGWPALEKLGPEAASRLRPGRPRR